MIDALSIPYAFAAIVAAVWFISELARGTQE